jgi:uncharacterized membrane protein
MKDYYADVIKRVQKSTIKLKIISAFITYLFVSILIYKFAKTVKDAFLLGVCVYGVYDFTCFSIFEEYPLGAVIIDTLWGGVLMATVKYLL